MSDITAPTGIDAAELTLLVGEPGARAYDAYPIDLADRAEAQQALSDLPAEATALVGIEFDDPEESGNRIVLADEGLDAARFVDNHGHRLAPDHVLPRLDSLRRVVLTAAR
ncbi:hypothetical protein GII30_14970 [Gordonia amarae]|uniref:Uncharacterized protein n=2 Tax=Gordonia amarae TaxID=36821 RepID=G7GJX2_9ACTN|nr:MULTISPECIES: hypothetical protein [Gordonia]MCS3879706.1 hypothetical protein [Gordonia amarae]OBA59259.1 hypothetical protein A5777_05325 [Gordonia sp. 852002-10350_SCH5691597]QHN18146.1 hypothetical protein GII35_15285 [Gordonia amarae]QHN31533.1 hypothetical protein GII32_15135 [Gordonia amarae]QHN40277.1 hypothetical protein GII30_14970 [Gordonia amarae]